MALLGTTGLAWSIMARRSKERRATVVLERPSVLHETLGGDPVRHVAGHLDEPTGLEPSNPNDLRVEGWAFSQENPVCHVEVWLDGRLLGRAAIGRPRPDVAVALGRPAAVLSGFELLLRRSRWPIAPTAGPHRCRLRSRCSMAQRIGGCPTLCPCSAPSRYWRPRQGHRLP